ncbi:MAG: glycerol kinase [Faecousia sp.]
MSKFILSVDQSTQGTKALLFDETGLLAARADLAHRQIVNDLGWVEHDPEEIYANVLRAVKNVVEKAGIDKRDIRAMGISNQRETSLAWMPDGTPVCNAVVWQCARAKPLCEELSGKSDLIRNATGLPLSPYFPAGKLAWILRNVPGAAENARAGRLRMGTMDTYLVYRLTHGRQYRTDYSNASRTQLFNIHSLSWDREICGLFGIPPETLATVTDSNGFFGSTDLEGFLEEEIPIHGVLGDSHGALFGHGCFEPGMVKATYGTGSSVMMNIGRAPAVSKHGVVTSLAWGMDGQVSYVLEGNINYTGAVISWLKDDVGLISSAKETQTLAEQANPKDRTYLVPAFTGLGAPYWDSEAQGILYGISRTTGRREIVRAALECIAFQITDILGAMSEDAGIGIAQLRVDGGPTQNRYLMQVQADIARIPVAVPPAEELSGMGAAYAAGIGCGLYTKELLFGGRKTTLYTPSLPEKEAAQKYAGWKTAVSKALH